MIKLVSTSPTIGSVSLRINPIQQNIGIMPNIKRVDKTTKSPDTSTILESAADNYGRALVFKGISEKIKNAVTRAPFEDKLAVGLQELRRSQGGGNFLLIAKNLKEIKNLTQYLDLPAPVKKLIILTDEQIKENLLFTKLGQTITIFNTTNSPIITSDLEMLPPGAAIEVFSGDHFRLPDGWIEIKEKPDTDVDLEKHSSLFMQVLDYTTQFIELAQKHNKNIIDFINTIDKPKEKSKGLTFNAVGGQDIVIEALKKNILFPLKYPDVFDGFMVSRGAILYGPPGTGKTLLAQTLAAESGASIFELCATDLADKYVGESEKNCRELFSKAVDAQPSIIYFDEIDALGKARGKDKYGDKLLAQFLSLMSDLEKRGDNVFVIGSTNRKEDLDTAFTRSGRFSTLLEVKAPDLKGTRQILDIHTKGKPIDEDVDKDNIAKRIYEKKMTGADIALTVKEAFSHALERTGIYESMKKNAYSPLMKEYLTINTEDFIYAIDNFKSGANNRTPVGFKK